MKYEKSIYIFIVLLSLCSCRTTRVSDNGNGIEQARSDLSELEAEQRNVTERVDEVTDGVENLESELTEGLTELEERLGESINSLAERTDDFTEFERILERVRNRTAGTSD